MKFQGAVIKEQGITFAVVVVRMSTLGAPANREKAIATYSRLFNNIPIALMAQDLKGKAKYFGRSDIVTYLSKLKLSQIPWKEYTTS